MAVTCTVLTAIDEGVGSVGEFLPDAIFKSGFKYEVTAIDYGTKTITAEVRPYP